MIPTRRAGPGFTGCSTICRPTRDPLLQASRVGRQLANGARQGRNDFGKIGYNGPCPPRGAAHRYFFKLYALDSKTNLKPGATKAELERAIKGHVLANAELVGLFQH